MLAPMPPIPVPLAMPPPPLAGIDPENLMLAAGAGLAGLGLSSTDAIVSLIVFVIIASLTIAGPLVYYLLGCYLPGGDKARAQLGGMKNWLALNNAIMAVPFLILGVNLIAKGMPPLTYTGSTAYASPASAKALPPRGPSGARRSAGRLPSRR